MKFIKNPEDYFLELMCEEEEESSYFDIRKKIASVEPEEIDNLISIAKEHKNKRLVEYLTDRKEIAKSREISWFDFYYNLFRILQRQRYSKNKYPLYHKIKALIKDDIELCVKYEAVFQVYIDFNNSMKTLEKTRTLLKKVKEEVEDDCFFDAIGESLLENKPGNSQDYLPLWFYC